MAEVSATIRNTAPGEGGPGGARLEVKVGAFYLLCLLTETEPRGLAGAVATRVKFQRGYEGHALDDIVVEANNAAGVPVSLEIQAKRTLDFTASDAPFAKVVNQIVSATGEAAERPIAAAIARTNTKIERHYQQLLTVARKMGSGAALRRALDADRVVSAGMRDFAKAFADQLAAAGASSDDEALWAVLKRFQILVFDFESPGAISTLLALALAQITLPTADRQRAGELWSALQDLSLDYDADGGEIDRVELIRWLRDVRGFELAPSRQVAVARRRLADHSQAALDVIEDSVDGVPLDRSPRIDEVAAALEGARYVEVVGASGVGKSAILKAVAGESMPAAFPVFLSPARIPPGGWLAFSRDLGLEGSAESFLSEMAASGATILFIDSLDRIADAGARETVRDLLAAALRAPSLQVVVSVGPDFDADQRVWLPSATLDLMGRVSVTVGPLTNPEAAALGQASPRLAQLLTNADAQPLTRNLYQLRRLLQRAGVLALPLTEAALARSWWETASGLEPIPQRDRVRAMRGLGAQVLAQATRLDIADIASPVVSDLLRIDDLIELVPGATGAFKHDVLRDWSAANLLREQPVRVAELPLHELAPTGLARAVELHARMLIEEDPTGAAWAALVARLRADGVHPSWLRNALLALVRSEQGVTALDRAYETLVSDRGRLLLELIRFTIAADSESIVERLSAAGLPRALIPDNVRAPTTLSWLRLTVWLLGRLDQLDVPVGREVLHLFSTWLMTNGGLVAIKRAIIQRLFSWLTVIEGLPRCSDAAPDFSQLFADGGRSDDLGRDIRGQFLLFCDQSPDLAAAYLTTKTNGDARHDVVSDVLKISQASAKAAPAALAAFTVEALINAETRYREKHDGRNRRRFDLPTDVFLKPGPDRGPFLAILRSNAAEGLRLVRRIVDYGLGLDGEDRDRPESFTLDVPDGPLRVLAPGAYAIGRGTGSAQLVTCALRALEAWGHEQVDAGRPVGDVLSDLLGAGDVAAPILAVAVDVLLSHVAAPDPLLIPYVTSPELLHLDWERFNQDRLGIGQLEGADPQTVPEAVSNATLRARGSRETTLSWAISGFLLSSDTDALEAVRAAVARGSDRLRQAAPDADAGARGPLFQAEHALRILDRANWRKVHATRDDGQLVAAYEYVEPPEEAALLEPRRTGSNAGLAETLLIVSLAQAVVDPQHRSDDILDRGLAWAQAQDLSALREDDADFERSQRWRAVVAAATLSILDDARPQARAWALIVLRRAREVDVRDRGYQIQYHALALATVGWAALAMEGDAEGEAALCDLAGEEAQTVVAAIGRMMDALAVADPRLPPALLRIGLVAALQPERSWDDEALTAERQARRDGLLAAAIAAETAWLAGGSEPPWPELPQARRFKKRHCGIRLPGPPAIAEVVEDDEAVPQAKPELWFNDHSAGEWLSVIEQSRQVRDQPWIAELVAAYQDFSDAAWGLGLPQDEESTNLPTRWLHPFDRLRLRAAANLGDAEFEAAVMTPLVGLPDQAFLDSAEELVNAFDSLFWDEKRISIRRLTAGRAQLIARVMACRVWRWGRDELTDTVPIDLSSTIQTLFLHTRGPFGPGRCFLPANGAAFAPIFPALVDLTGDAPGRSYVTAYFLTLLEAAQAWVPLDVMLSAAEAWAQARPDEAGFWRDRAFGRRVCTLIGSQIVRIQSAGPYVVTRARRLVERLISAGVPEALPLEQLLTSLS